MSQTVPVIEASHIGKSIGDTAILRDISLTMAPGTSLAIMGPNGAGKTTLLRILSGLWAPSQGELRRFGVRVDKEANSDRRIGFLGHQSFLYPAFSARENLMFYARLWGMSQPAAHAAAALRRVGLGWSQDDPLRTFSRGMLQRAAIARMLLSGPELVLLDEPYTGLDFAGRKLLDGVLDEIKGAGRSVVMISHRVDEVMRSADAVAIMDRGQLTWWSGVSAVSPEYLARVCQGQLDAGGWHHS